MSVRMSRVFHPVGQGAFYSEHFVVDETNDFNVVYDCGTDSKDYPNSDILFQGFNKDTEIDILFLSHFDKDHISLVDTLKNSVKSVKVVIMPLLSEFDKFVVCLKNGNDMVLRILLFPESFWGNGTKVFYVSGDAGESSDDITFSRLLERSSSVLPSKTAITINGVISTKGNLKETWCYVPYNKNRIKMHASLRNKLQSCWSNIHDDISTFDKYKKMLKQAYSALPTKAPLTAINYNSMIVYSGPLPIDTTCVGKVRHYWISFVYSFIKDVVDDLKTYEIIPPCCDYRVGCVYTGDVGTKEIKLWSNNAFKRCRKFVGTIQVPHHGSGTLFSATFLKGGNYICPISFGIPNRHNHPNAEVLKDIMMSGSLSVPVTQHCWLEQRIWLS